MGLAFAALLLLCGVAAGPAAARTRVLLPPVPCCQTYDDVRRLDRQRVRIVGTYRPTKVAKRHPKDAPPPVDLGTPQVVAIETPAGAIHLGVYHDPAARRPPDELGRLAGKRVVVTGRLHARTPPQPQAATMIGPYVDVQAIAEHPPDTDEGRAVVALWDAGVDVPVERVVLRPAPSFPGVTVVGRHRPVTRARHEETAVAGVTTPAGARTVRAAGATLLGEPFRRGGQARLDAARRFAEEIVLAFEEPVERPPARLEPRLRPFVRPSVRASGEGVVYRAWARRGTGGPAGAYRLWTVTFDRTGALVDAAATADVVDPWADDPAFPRRARPPR